MFREWCENMTISKPLQMEPIDSSSVVEQVIQQITKMISLGRFKLGERLPSEFELMEELNVSRNSLREAMKMLSTMGIVEIKRGDGTYICQEMKPSIFDSLIYSMMVESSSDKEIIELRQLLDENVLKLAIKSCTEAEIEHLQQMIVTMKDFFDQGNISNAAKMDYQFHTYLTNCARNRFLCRIVTGVYKLFEGSIERNIRTEELFAMAVEHHQEIVDCLRNRNESLIPQVVANSLSSWRRNVRDKM